MSVALQRLRAKADPTKPASKRPRGGLRNRILYWAFVPTAIILATVGLVSLYTYQRVTEELVIERDRDLTRLSANQLAVVLANNADRLSEQFMEIFDSGMVMYDAEGRVLAAEPESMEGLGPDWHRLYPFRQLAREGTATFSDVIVNGRRGEKVIAGYVPIMGRDGEPVGGIGGLFRLRPSTDRSLYRQVERLRRGEDSVIYLVDSNGRAIYHSDPAYLGRDLSGQPVVQSVLGGAVGSVRAQDLGGQDIVASFAPVGDTGWGLVTEESWDSLMQSSRRYGRFMFALLGLGLAVPAILVTVGLRRIMQPVQELTEGAQAVASGNFQQRISATTGDELEELAEQFNLMAAQLQDSYDHLEREVAERTQELATLNRLAGVVSRSLHLEEILNDALDEALGIMSMSHGQAFLLEEDTGKLVLVAHRGANPQLTHQIERLPLGATTAGLAAEAGQAVFRLAADYPDGDLKALLESEGIDLVVSTPLMAKGKVLGAIDLWSTSLRTISPEQLSLLAAIGHQIGVAVENARLYERAQQVAVLEERSRLARELHDAVTQTLFSASLLAQTMPAVWEQDPDEGRRLLAQLRRLSRAALAEMRALLLELRPAALCEASLEQLLRELAETTTGRTGVPVHVQVEGQAELPEDVHVALYRLAQEALNNVAKHAQASHVLVRLRYLDPRDGDNGHRGMGAHPSNPDSVELLVRDNGRGFSPDVVRPGEMGLSIMRERAGSIGATLRIESQPEQGTCVVVVWPNGAEADERRAHKDTTQRRALHK